MKRKTVYRSVAAASLIAAVAVGVIATTKGGLLAGDGDGARAKLRDTSGNPVGQAKLTQEDDDTVLVRVTVHGLPAGFHGFHIHAKGACAPDFAAALGHFNPAGASHPGHAADMPVLLVNSDGTGEARFRTDRVALSDLFDSDGSALIIHAAPDNYANIPVARYDPDPDATTLSTGDAGGRIACGVIEH